MKIDIWKLKITIIILLVLVFTLSGYLFYLSYNNLDNPIFVSQKNMNTNDNIDIRIRPAAVAGMFYPADKNQLSNEVDKYLNDAKVQRDESDKMPKIILVPHAGYEYSGPVAAHGYKMLEGQDIKRVIILGSSHNYPITGVIVDGNDSWETPLGKVDLDKEIIAKLQIPIDSEPFAPEHALEVQLPFLQKVLPEGFKIVPLIVGDDDQKQLKGFAKSLTAVIDDQTVIIVSSDMSHYPKFDDASKCDGEVIKSILTGDADKFDNKIAELEKRNISNAATFMCAKPAVDLGLMIAKKVGAQRAVLLQYANSGDATGDRSRVVGYSAIGFFENNSVGSEQQTLLKIARDSVESFVKNGKIPESSSAEPQSALLRQKSGVFVTLTSSGQLRGCIGLMESNEPLYKTVPHMAVAAAVDDPRFSPVAVEDLPKLKYEVSVLSPMQRIKNVDEIELGKHGVKVQRAGRSGVFLPQVAQETGWSKEEFLNRLCQDKAGLPEDCWKDAATEIFIFTAQVFSD